MASLPRTVIALFAYGRVEAATASNLTRDVCLAAYTAGQRTMLNILKARGISIPLDLDALVAWEVGVGWMDGDALVSRARNRVVAEFIKDSGYDVLLMIDHDLSWRGAVINAGTMQYEGDLLRLARKAHEMGGIVGAAVPKRTKGEGIASKPFKLDIDKDYPYGGIDAPVVCFDYLGAGCTAYPRRVLQAIWDTFPATELGYRSIFEAIVVPHPDFPPDSGKMLPLSEDWAVSHRARLLGFESYVDFCPVVSHYGPYEYTVLGDAIPKKEQSKMSGENVGVPAASVASSSPRPRHCISLLHASRGRPEIAAGIEAKWRAASSGLHDVEYILSIDDDDPRALAYRGDFDSSKMLGLRRLLSGPSRGNVDAYNRAAYTATGEIFVQVHDDVEPLQKWDEEIVKRIPDVSAPRVLFVSDGLPASVNAGKEIACIMICTKTWAVHLGGLFYPGYVSLFCDDDATEKARKGGELIMAKELVFKHDWQGADRDETQKRSYSKRNKILGEALLKMRREQGFPDAMGMWGAI